MTESVRLSEVLITKDEELEELNATLEERQRADEGVNATESNPEERVKEEVEKPRKTVFISTSTLGFDGRDDANIAHQWRQPLSELNITLYKMNKLYQA